MQWFDLKRYVSRMSTKTFFDAAILKEWADSHGIVSFTPFSWVSYSAEKTLKRGKRSRPSMNDKRPPYLDHDDLFKSEFGSLYLAYHSYAPIEEIKSAVEEWACAYELVCHIGETPSWYYPAKATLIVIDSLI